MVTSSHFARIKKPLMSPVVKINSMTTDNHNESAAFMRISQLCPSSHFNIRNSPVMWLLCDNCSPRCEWRPHLEATRKNKDELKLLRPAKGIAIF